MSRPQWLRLHRYAGLTMALFLLSQALTGALLLYRGPVERLLDPAGQTSQGNGPLISAGQAAASASAAVPHSHLVRLLAPDCRRATWFAHMSDDDGRMAYATVDPAGGAVLRHGGLMDFPLEAVLRLHYEFLTGRAGTIVILLNGLALGFLAISGLSFWWPKRRPLQSLTVRWNLSFRLVLRQLHRSAGVASSAFFLLIAGTGFLMAVPNLLDSAPILPPIAPSVAQIDTSVALAHKAFPASQLRDIQVRKDGLKINFHAPDRNVRAVHVVVAALPSLRVVSTMPAEQSRALWMPLLPLHTGEFIGLAGSILWLAIALLLAALAISGPLMWWHATAQRGRVSRKVSV